MFRAVIIDFIDGFLIFACILNFLIGLILLLKPDLIKSLNQMLSKWISTRKLTKPIGKGLDFQNLLLKYNTIFGWLLLIGFSICIYVYFHNVRIGMINQFIISNKWGPLLEILIITLNWVLILFLSI
ncbi:MAG: hypothetical protein ACE5D7_05635, partial [Fidelibacterota bacterium]